MEASQETTTQELPEKNELTAKQMAAAEEANTVRAKALSERANEEPEKPAVAISEVAARGYDALNEQFRLHNERTKAAHREYVPPPRTERQMSALEEELEAGRKVQQRAEAQKAASQPVKPDGGKEGFTTPVYRPNDVVPDPIKGGMKGFSPDV